MGTDVESPPSWRRPPGALLARLGLRGGNRRVVGTLLLLVGSVAALWLVAGEDALLDWSRRFHEGVGNSGLQQAAVTLAVRAEPAGGVAGGGAQPEQQQEAPRQQGLDLRGGLLRIKRDLEAELALCEDEITPDMLSRRVPTPYDGDIEDRHSVVDPECPRYVTMDKSSHGMGHQISMYVTTLLTALFFNLTLADAPYGLETAHGTYGSIGDFTGLGHGEHTLAEVRAKVNKTIVVDAMPMAPTTDDLPQLYEPLRKAFRETHAGECNVLFQVSPYYSYDYGTAVKPIVARKYKEAPRRRPVEMVYDPNEFTVALHVRVGDITPTAEAFHAAVLRQALPVLAAQRVPCRVHVFASQKGAAAFPAIVEAVRAAGGNLTFHPDMSAFDTFHHLTQPHVFVMSASGFSQFPAILGTKALVFSPPSRETFPFKFCPPFAVCCDGQGGFGPDGVARLQRRAERWRTVRRLEADVAEIDRLLEALGSSSSFC